MRFTWRTMTVVVHRRETSDDLKADGITNVSLWAFKNGVEKHHYNTSVLDMASIPHDKLIEGFIDFLDDVQRIDLY